VQMNRSPIIRANQAHPVSGRDREAATIAGLPEAVLVNLPYIFAYSFVDLSP
jgi:hypothetical protein